jgi:gliding motility-associated-like protein
MNLFILFYGLKKIILKHTAMKRNISNTRFICRYTKRIFFLFSLLIAANTTLGQISISKTVVPKSICNQFDVTLSITGTPPAKPIDVILVIDNSGSMGNGSPSSMYYAKQAALNFMRKVYSATNSDQNRVGIVSYSNYGVEEIQLSYPSDSTTVKNKINALVATNYTNIADGFYQAAKEMHSRGRTDCDVLHSIVLLTDGVANQGNTYNSANDRYQGSCSETYPTVANACTNMAITQGQAAWTFIVGGVTYNTKVTTVGLFGGLNSYPASKTLAQSVLNSAQNAGFYQTDAAADLNGIYNQIFLQLLWAAKAIPGVPMVSDTITPGFAFIPGTLTTSKGTATVNNQIITWPLDFVNNETVSLNYSLEANTQFVCGNQNSSKSWMTYEDVTCTHRAIMFTPPTICVPCPKITPISVVQQNCTQTIHYEGTLTDEGAVCHPSHSYLWTFKIDGVEVGTAQGLSGTFWIPNQYFTESCNKKLTGILNYISGSGCTMNLGASQEITLRIVTSIPIVPFNGASTVQCIAAATEPTPPVIYDICGIQIPYQLSITDVPATLTCEGTRTYNYVYTNCAGLSATWKYIYTIDRTTIPGIVGEVVPTSSTIACIDLATAPTTFPVVKDACGNILTPGIPTVGGTYTNCEGTRTYTYTYTDCSGLTYSWEYTYTIDRDDFTLPTNGSLAVACVSEIALPTPPAVNDNCGNVINPTGPVISGNPVCQGTKTYTWTYADCEGNTHDWSFVYKLKDTIAPILSGILPEGEDNMDICLASVPVGPSANDIKSLYTDNCGGAVTVTKTATPSGNDCNWSLTYSYEVKDACGNIVSPLPTIIYSGGDKTNPVIVCPVVPPSVWPNSGPNFIQSGSSWDATATDNCSIPSILFTLSGATISPNNLSTLDGVTFNYGSTLVTWTATDACGNKSSCSITINVMDNTPPLISCPQTISVSCSEQIPAAYATLVQFIAAGGSVSDNVGIDILSFKLLSESTNGLRCPETIIRYYQIADIIGNNTTCSQLIIISDTVAPVFTPLPQLSTINCPAEPAFAQAKATDNCIGAISLTYNDVKIDGQCAGSYSVTRTWTATDVCGNSSTASQTINIQDVTAPVIAALPEPSTISCPDSPVFAQAEATDECGSAFTLTYDDVRTKGQCRGSYIMTRTWTATDACGNSSQASQIINVQDIFAPVISHLPETTTIDCPATPVFAQATAVDECHSGFELTFSDVTTNGECAGSYSITRTWTAIDACGNSSTATQTIIVQDTTPPKIVCPANIIVNNDMGMNGANIIVQQPTYEESCSSVLLTNSFNHTDNASGFYPVGNTNVEWTATDACGNYSNCTMTITVIDNEPPVVICPENIISCSTDFSLGYPEASDNSGILSIVNDAPSIFPIGLTTIVTWTITDIHENISICKQAVTISNLLVSAEGSSQVSCHNASDGSITVSASGGTGYYLYSLDGTTFGPSNQFNGLPEGSYSVTVKDSLGCTAITKVLIITNPDLLDASAMGSSQVSCNNSSDGFIFANASGGTGDYLYSLNGGAFSSSAEFTGLGAGSYVITVKDEKGCTDDADEIVIANPDLLVATATGSAQVKCNNSSDGFIHVSVIGGTGDYTYSLNGGSFGTSGEFTGLLSGTYIVTVKDENGCTAVTDAFVIDNPDLLIAIAAGSAQVSCHDGSDGIIDVNVTGGTDAYSYSLNGGAFGPTGEFTGLSAGSYFITVMDKNKCIATTDFTIENPPAIAITTNSNSQVSCNNGSDGVIIIAAQGGTGDYAYALNEGGFQLNHVFTNLPAGNYTVRVMDENGCIAESSEIIIENPNPITVGSSILSGNSCFGEADASVAVYASGGTSPYTYSFDGSEPAGISEFTHLIAGSHVIVAYDKNGCIGNGHVNIESQTELLTSVLSYADANCVGKSDGSVEVTGIGGVPPYTYSWSTGAETPKISGLDAGAYIVTVTDANGCISINTQTVKAGITSEDIVINTAFSPNGDGINDKWTIHNLDLYPDNEVVVINRWGNEVYSQKSYQSNWDGSNLTEGTYFYIIKVSMCGESRDFKGYITIVR